MSQHKDCINFKDGFCILHEKKIDSSAEACPDFEPSVKNMENSHLLEKWVALLSVGGMKYNDGEPLNFSKIKKIYNEMSRRISKGEMKYQFGDSSKELIEMIEKSEISGIFLREPHAAFIFKELQDLIVFTEHVPGILEQNLGLFGDKAYGTIYFTEVKEVSLPEFGDLRERHRITEDERKEWAQFDDNWEEGPFFAYEFEFTPFDEPVDYFSLGKITKMFISKELIMKPEGPWGEGFDECVEWQIKNNEDISDEESARKYCGAIYQQQNKAVENLERVDAKFVNDLSDDELAELDEVLHEKYKEEEEINEPLLNAHIFVWNEMKERKIEHNIEDRLTSETRFWITEYPPPRMIKINEVIEAFPRELKLDEEDLQIFLCGGIVNRGWVTGQDIDVRIGSWDRDPEVEKRIIHGINDNKIREKVSFIWDPDDGIGKQLLLYASDSVQLFDPTQPMKPSKAAEYTDPQELYDSWVAPRLEEGLMIQPKIDGMAFQIHVDDDKINAYTEDSLRNRANCFDTALDGLKGKRAVIVTEMVEYTDEVINNDADEMHKKYKQIPREDLIKWIAADPTKLDDKKVIFHCHDLLYLDGEPLVDQDYKERYFKLKELLDDAGSHIEVIESWEADTKGAFEEALKKARHYPNSEGAVIKTVDSKYKVDKENVQRTKEWSKVKNIKSIDVMVFNRHDVADSPGVYTYQGYVGPLTAKQKRENWRGDDLKEFEDEKYLRIGTTYNVKENLEPGDILEVRPIRLELNEKGSKKWLTWMFPIVGIPRSEKDEPDSLDFALKLADLGTAPFEKATNIIRLEACPFWNDDEICPLKKKIKVVEKAEEEWVEWLRYPVDECRLASFYRCYYIKPYYYGFRRVKNK